MKKMMCHRFTSQSAPGANYAQDADEKKLLKRVVMCLQACLVVVDDTSFAVSRRRRAVEVESE